MPAQLDVFIMPVASDGLVELAQQEGTYYDTWGAESWANHAASEIQLSNPSTLYAPLFWKWTAPHDGPFSAQAKNYMSNLKATLTNSLTPEEMTELETVDCNSRLIKGQVFLWKGAKGWEDLWDLDGTIPH